MPGSKKRKISGLKVAESDSDPTPTDTLTDQIDNLIAALELRVLSLSFAAANEEAMGRLNIVEKGRLILRGGADLRQPTVASLSVGSDKFWSNDHFFQHLSFLLNTVAGENEASARMVIDTFFFRSAAMLSSPQVVVMMLENPVTAVHPTLSLNDTISGIIDYTVIVAKPSDAVNFLLSSPKMTAKYSDRTIAFFAVEAKGNQNPLEDYLPRVLLQLVACAKYLKKSHIHGTLTNSFMWYFIAMELDADGNCAKHWKPQPVKWDVHDDGKPLERHVDDLTENTHPTYHPALIVGILLSWIPESLTVFNDVSGLSGALGEMCDDAIGYQRMEGIRLGLVNCSAVRRGNRAVC
ncbi:hypothetical protein BV25DRAFT_1919362 [Artomyces pyxidatus]|uniref:Uncharacterized protein n=1 Tax=Artomyces pyxidatus TaxID=48021 RepID=A0ACB8SRT2_9AGAM|nr:hypothetical protein BV25DRAFT_1919362 [Artomyces pyxidatus]